MKKIMLCSIFIFLLGNPAFAAPDTLDFRVNDVIENDQNYPSIAVNGQGRIIIVWQDYRNNNYDIYAQLFDSSGEKLDTNFMTNDDTGSTQQIYPNVAMDALGNFLVVWEDGRNTSQGDAFDIYAQLYDSAGNEVGNNFKVNRDIQTINQHNPSVSADGFGKYVVSWTDFREGNNDIYAQRISSSAGFIGDNFKVNDDLVNAQQHSSCAAMDYYGDFIIAWYDNRNGNNDIYCQRFDSSGAEIDSNFKANNDQTTTSQTFPQADMDNQGNFIIAWCDMRNGDEDIYGQRFGLDGLPIDTNFKANTDISSFKQINPTVAMDGWGDLIIAWQDDRDSISKDFDIYAQKYDNLGNTEGPNFRVNSDTLRAIQAYPKIATNGDFIYFAWADQRILANGVDIYARFLPWLIGNFGRISLSYGSHNFGDVLVGGSSDWEFRIYNVGEQSLSVDSIISTDSVYSILIPGFPRQIAKNDSVRVVVRFSPLHGYFYQENLFVYNSDPDNPIVRVGLSGWGYPHQPSLFSLISPSNESRVYALPLSLIWERSFPANPNNSITYTLWYGTDSSFSVKNEVSDIADTQYTISDSLIEDTIYYWRVKAEDGSGGYIWSEQSDWYWLTNLENQYPGNFDLILPQYQDTIGTLLPTFVWHKPNDDDILDTIKYNLYYDTLSGFSTTQMISNIADTFYTIIDSLKEGKTYYWKVEARDIAGFITLCDSVWNFTTMGGTGVRENPTTQMPDHPILEQNYPNPFNCQTNIRYFLNKNTKVSITIYNLLGQKVKEFSSYQTNGWKEISWDAKDQNGRPVSSGIYFYELSAGYFVSIKKMTLVK